MITDGNNKWHYLANKFSPLLRETASKSDGGFITLIFFIYSDQETKEIDIIEIAWIMIFVKLFYQQKIQKKY